MIDAALLLGNDYLKRIYNNGPVMVLGKDENEKDTTKGDSKGPRANGLIDRLAEADDKT